jgi:ElaB/YqjD/DUF883 family membrane-anchored ribosome-binding protein
MSNGFQSDERSRAGTRGGQSNSIHDVSIQPTAEADAAAARANDLAAETQDATDALAADLKDAVSSLGSAAREQASEFAAGLGDELSQTAESQKARGVEMLQCFMRAIGSAAGELERQSPKVARSVREAATKVGSLSDTISNRNVNELLKAATDFARSQPLAFVGGAALAGFALSRFLKSSAGNQLGGGGSQSAT